MQKALVRASEPTGVDGKLGKQTVESLERHYGKQMVGKLFATPTANMLKASRKYSPGKTNLLVDLVKADQKSEEQIDDQK
jgi:lysozyme family protein